MRRTSGPAKKRAEAVIKGIRRATCRQFSSEEKIHMQQEGAGDGPELLLLNAKTVPNPLTTDSRIRCTARKEIPTRLATVRWVSWATSSGGSEQGSASACATIRVECGRVPGEQILSRERPSTPASAKRCCQRQTVGRLMPSYRATSCTVRRSAESRTIQARGMCLRGRDRSPAITGDHGQR